MAAAALVVFAECKGLKPTPGAKCVANGKFQCTDPSSAILCQAGVYVALPCRGPHGCAGTGLQSKCDDDLATEGDACMMTLNENYACTSDHTKELICKDGKFVTLRTCKGPSKCTIANETLNCDDSIADVGDACVAEAGDANYGCSLDKKIEVVCDAATSKFQSFTACRGQKGCNIEKDVVHCDRTIGRVGEQCHTADDRSCSEDATAELKCSPQLRWLKQQDCKHDGCKVKGNYISCG